MNEQTTASATITTSTPDIGTAVLGLKVDNLTRTVEEMHKDVKDILALQARHDERIRQLEEKGKWAGGIFSALLVYILTKVGLPHP